MRACDMADLNTTLVVSVGRQILLAYMDLFANAFGIGPLIRAVLKVQGGTVNPDETLTKLDEAKAAMADALVALDSVRSEAETRVLELEEARDALNKVLASKAESEEKLKAIQQIANADLATFRKMAGVTSPYVAFASGVFASIVAATLWWGAPKLWALVATAIHG